MLCDLLRIMFNDSCYVIYYVFCHTFIIISNSRVESYDKLNADFSTYNAWSELSPQKHDATFEKNKTFGL